MERASARRDLAASTVRKKHARIIAQNMERKYQIKILMLKFGGYLPFTKDFNDDFRCKDGICKCRNIWKGEDCSIRACAKGSLVRGNIFYDNIIDYRYFCDFMVFTFFVGEPAKLCFGHGKCEEKTGICECWNQFTGFNCARKKCIPSCAGGTS